MCCKQEILPFTREPKSFEVVDAELDRISRLRIETQNLLEQAQLDVETAWKSYSKAVHARDFRNMNLQDKVGKLANVRAERLTREYEHLWQLENQIWRENEAVTFNGELASFHKLRLLKNEAQVPSNLSH